MLDIGSGWGGLALDLARDCNADVLGVTLVRRAIRASPASARPSAGLAERCNFELDRLSRAGRHIRPHRLRRHVRACRRALLPGLFAKVRDLLKDDGVPLIHTIGRSDGPGVTNPWIAKYIFPGGYTPALSEILPVIERSGLIVTDVEVLRLHYAETLKEWRARFKAHWRRGGGAL